MTQAEQYNAAYKASRDPRVLALLSIDEGSRYDAAYALALKGVVIDDEIDVRGASPYLEMQYRANDGLRWVPSILQPNVQSAGLLPGETPNPPFVPYDADHMPAGSCPVIADPAQFTPFPVPAAPVDPNAIGSTPKAGDKLVGGAKGGNWWDLSDLARRTALNDGFVWALEGDGHSYMLHVQSFGVKIWQRLS